MRHILSVTLLCLVLHHPVHAEETAASPPPAPPQTHQLSDEAKARLEVSAVVMQATGLQIEGKTDEANKAFLQAISLYDALLTKNPEDIASLNGRALARHALDDPNFREDAQKAIDITTARLAEKPDDARLHHDRAIAYRTLDMYDEASRDYARAIELAPDRENWKLDLRAMNAARRMNEATGK